MSDRDGEQGWVLGVRMLVASRALFDELHRRLAAQGHPDLRPAHGFLFQSLGDRGATASEIAGRLGFTKQAARLVINELIDGGYVRRGDDPDDARRRPVVLTARGADALRRSEAIFDELRAELAGDVGAARLDEFVALLAAVDQRYGPAPLRPVW